MHVVPVILEGSAVRLEPLSLAHVEPLAAVGLDPAIWRWSPYPVDTRDDMRAYVETALAACSAGVALPFATVRRDTGDVIGTTRFGNIDVANRRAEIGWTWLGVAHQRTAANTEAKYLMLRHAFETWRCIRVEFKTDSLNDKSRSALRRLGAVEEGTLRNHMTTASGRYRHSVYFSIVDDEWPAVRERLEGFMQRPPGAVGAADGEGHRP